MHALEKKTMRLGCHSQESRGGRASLPGTGVAGRLASLPEWVGVEFIGFSILLCFRCIISNVGANPCGRPTLAVAPLGKCKTCPIRIKLR